jgi:type IV pilus assembly protein PilY1
MQQSLSFERPAAPLFKTFSRLGMIAGTLLLLSCPAAVPGAPAFLAPGASPNVLMVLDNSESMLELAYMPDTDVCHDTLPTGGTETGLAGNMAYQGATRYAGYFSTDQWYGYDAARTLFKVVSKPSTCSGSSGPAYTHARGQVEELCVQLSSASVGFKARGNFLNWATASRFDILKKVLTGGKFNPLDRTLISEGRGCPGTRFIRQIPVWDTSTDTAHILSLGIRALIPDLDHTTAVEVFAPHPTGLDDSMCQLAFHNLPSLADIAPAVNTLLETCLESPELPFVLPRAADPSTRIPLKPGQVNLPALLTDRLAEEQLGLPLLVMQGVIADPRYADVAPRGILHQSAGRLRVGIMKFNHDGSRSECGRTQGASADSALFDLAENNCSGGSLDGGSVVVDIQDSTPARIDHMVKHVNAVQADGWSPLAEAVFTAIGYYTQRPDMRINPSDFSLDSAPCTHWCQGNNILVITDGASTVDLHPQMATFASVEGQNDGTRDSMDGCPGLMGSTFLDDITAYGFSGNNIHLEAPFDADEHYQNIKTYFVVAGSLSARGEEECSPTTLLTQAAANGGTRAPYFADDPQDLEAELKTALHMIRSGGYAGPTASVYSAHPNSGGAVYRSRFWSSVEAASAVDGAAAADVQVTWIGDVNALLMDADGKLYEDTDRNGALNTVDQPVSIYHDVEADGPRACSQEPEIDGTCLGRVKTLDRVNHLWSAAEWLASIPNTDVNTNREDYISETRQRFIFTWNDLDDNGAVAANEILPFVPLKDWCGPQLSVADSRTPIPADFGVNSTAEVNDIVRWLRGLDTPGDTSLRSRQVDLPSNFSLDSDPAIITWRLGDIIHSTPTVVAGPMEKYHLLYEDEAYAAFAAAHLLRRHVIYFGGNDGMVHAVNGGFYDPARRKFWRGRDPVTGQFSDVGPALGAELWAYVPYNLLPHLKRLTRKGYQHTYFVDLTPRVFDVQIFDSSPDSLGHVHGWGTIMVMGMRLGGHRLAAQEMIAGTPWETCIDDRIFTSAYMVFDITDPENPPRLLGELTFQSPGSIHMGYTTAMPAVAPIKTGEYGSDWFLILGSGPTHATGVSTQNARISVFPLTALDEGQAFRIPAAAAYSHAHGGSHDLTKSPNGFVSGITVADYHLNARYKADAVYFGTIQGSWEDWDGRVYRWITNEGFPQSWNDPTVMFNPHRPVTAAPVIGFDGDFHWVYFGTGRFLDVKDKSDANSNAPDYFFGLKEPKDMFTSDFTWASIENKTAVSTPAPANNAGARTLLRVDQIEVAEAFSAAFAPLACRNNTDCLPDEVITFKDLVNYIVGRCDAGLGCTGTDGWVRVFEAPQERNLGQGTLLGGLIGFTTYQPFQDICKPAGQSFFYNLHFQTGTPFYGSMTDARIDRTMDDPSTGSPRMVSAVLPVGRGLAITPRLRVGRQQGSQVFVQTSSGATMVIPQTNLPVKTVKSGRLSWQSLP